MYYHLTLEEQNGEQEYHYDYLVQADNYEEAMRLSREEAQRFYDDDGELVEDLEDTYEFFGGSIYVSVYSLRETTREDFIDYLLSVRTIGPREEKVCHG